MNNSRDQSRNFLGIKRADTRGLGIRGRKGFTYLLVTTVIVAVLLSMFFATSRYKFQDEESLQQVRIRAMNDFVKNLNTDIHRATYISAFRALLALEDHVTTSGVYLTNINESFRETFFYGTINGSSASVMDNSTFNDYLTKVRVVAQATGITLNISVTNIKMLQSDPWSIDVYMFMNITVKDNKNTASWNIGKEYVTNVPIVNLRDPLYSKNTFNRVPNSIRQISSTTLVNGTNTSALQEHISGSYYIASPYAPNFVMRFEGKTDANPNGIESIVDITDLSDQDLEVFEDRIKVDYIYFNDITEDKICNIQNIDSGSYLVLPSNRVNLYQIHNSVANLTYSNSSICP